MELVDGPPEVLADRYELGEVLGRGGMGVVRSATDRRLGRAVAVKLLHPHLAVDRSAVGRFEDEALAAAQLVHPHVVGVFDTGEHDGAPYIVMECLPGRTLADEMAAGPLPVARVREVAGQVLGALEAAHGAGVIHRDIKPGNILLTAHGVAKVADFGIAKTTEGTDHTATGMIIGTPSYLAPERVLGRPASPQSDLYAVGVVLYEALTGTRPFGDRTPLAAAAAVQHEAPPPVHDVRPDVDDALADAVGRAMAKDPAERFTTAAEMAAALAGAPDTPTGPETTAMVATPATQVLPVAPAGAAPASAAAGPSGPVTPAPALGTAPVSLPRRLTGRPSAAVLATIAAGALGLVLLVTLLVGGEGGGGATGGDGNLPLPATAVPVGGEPSLPGPLEEPMRALEEAVQP
jgi:serine/threonine-protein kinase